MITLSSRRNVLIKHVKSLHKKRNRNEEGLFIIEGVRIINEAQTEGVQIKYVFVSDSFIKNGKLDKLHFDINKVADEIVRIPDDLFEYISETENPQGILAVLKQMNFEEEEIIKKGDFFLIIEQISDPGNLGTIIRTSDAGSVSGVFLTEGCVDIYNSKVIRSTMGSIFRVPTVYTRNIKDLIKELKKRNVNIFTSCVRGGSPYTKCDFTDKCAIVIGSEPFGAEEETIKNSDQIVSIPMPGGAESINASVASGILIFEVVRQRHS